MSRVVGVITVVLSIVLSLSCTRKKNDHAHIQLQLPQSKPITASTLTSEPTNTDEINCYYVMVGGPEEYMNTMSCGKKEINGTVTVDYVGGVFVGGVNKDLSPTVNIQVPVGRRRDFYLFGARSTSALGCRQYGIQTHNLDLKTTTSSNVYLLGTSLNNEIGSNETKVIDVATSIDPATWISNCITYGAAGGEVSGDLNAPASLLYIDKQTFPLNNRFRADTCEPFHVTPKNIFSKVTPLIANESVSTKLLLSGGGNTSIDTYPTAADCNNSPATNGSDSFTVPAGVTTVTRWMKIGSIANGSYKLQFVPSSSSLVPAYFSVVQNAYWNVNPVDPSTQTYSILAPELVLRNVCYPHKITLSDLNGTQVAVSSRNYGFSNYSSGSLGRTYSVYGDSACTQDITTTNTNNADTIYVKYHIAQSAGRANIVLNSSNVIGFRTMNSVGSATPASTAIVGARTLAVNRCEGPFMVYLSNADQGFLMNASGSAVTVSVASTQSHLFTDSSCSTSAQSTLSLSIPAGQEGGYFYMKGTSVDTTGVLTTTSSGLAAGSFNYSIEVF